MSAKYVAERICYKLRLTNVEEIYPPKATTALFIYFVTRLCRTKSKLKATKEPKIRDKKSDGSSRRLFLG